MGENFENAGLEEGEISDCDQSTEDEVDSIVAQSPSAAAGRAAEDDIDDAGLLRGMLQVSETIGDVMLSQSKLRRGNFLGGSRWRFDNHTSCNDFNEFHGRTLRRTSIVWLGPMPRRRSNAGYASPTRRTTSPRLGSTRASTCSVK